MAQGATTLCTRDSTMVWLLMSQVHSAPVFVPIPEGTVVYVTRCMPRRWMVIFLSWTVSQSMSWTRCHRKHPCRVERARGDVHQRLKKPYGGPAVGTPVVCCAGGCRDGPHGHPLLLPLPVRMTNYDLKPSHLGSNMGFMNIR